MVKFRQEATDIVIHRHAESLTVHLLGQVELPDVLRWQRRLAYEVGGEPETGALILCEHPPCISIGREGSRADIEFEPAELRSLRWPVGWLPRGGGVNLHLAGQLAVYAVLSLRDFRLTPGDFVAELHKIVCEVVAAYDLPAETRPGSPGVWTNGRPVATVGLQVRGGISTFGLTLNVNPDLAPYRHVRCHGAASRPMTSLERERRLPTRPALARQRLVEAFTERFGFARHTLSHALPMQTLPHALASPTR